jgi:hypothetical protein
VTHLHLVPSEERREPELVLSGEFVVEIEDTTRWPWGEPDFEAWLKLPTGPPCPGCGSELWGTENPRGYLLVRRCHGGCSTRFRTGDEYELAITALDLWARALGYRKRFAMRRATPEERRTGVVRS